MRSTASSEQDMRNPLTRLLRPAEGDSPEATFAAVGYPKVGNTWLRVTLGKYLQLTYGLAELPLLDRGDFPALRAARCHAVGEFTHAPLEWTVQTAADLSVENVVAPFREQKVILLVRHPLDTLVSLYMQQRYRARGNRYTGDIESFLRDPIFGLDKLIQFHRIWADSCAQISAFQLWRYEDTRRDPAASFRKVIEFLGLPVHMENIAASIEFASFDSMRSMELSGATPRYKSSGFGIFATGDQSNPDALHVRKGAVGGYRDELAPSLTYKLEQVLTSRMPAMFGYS